jgi:hypothetical protein
VTETQDHIIARPLAFFAHLESRIPNQRMKPEESASYLTWHLRQRIVSAHVSQFVGKHELELLSGPLAGFGRKKHGRSEGSPSEWDGYLGANSKLDGAGYTKTLADLLHDRFRLACFEQRRAPGKSAHSDLPAGNPRRHKHRPNRP